MGASGWDFSRKFRAKEREGSFGKVLLLVSGVLVWIAAATECRYRSSKIWLFFWQFQGAWAVSVRLPDAAEYFRD
ncbi:hypothetical protein PSCICL_45440 [Pseudomonas cichorii]|nr:hypothetical protein PSCICL_45440 [Pseudomonas cichorii]